MEIPPATPPVVDSPPVGPPSSGADPSATASAPASQGLAIAIPSQLQGAPTSGSISPLSLTALATTSIGGVLGTEGAASSSAPQVQFAAAFPSSSLTAGLVVLGTSLPLLSYGEVDVATPSARDGGEPQTTDVEAPRIDSDSSAPEGDEARTLAPTGDFPAVRATSPSVLSRAEHGPQTGPISVAAAAGPDQPGPPVAYREPSSQADDLGRHVWRRARAYILAVAGFALGAYVHCRGFGRRGERGGDTRKRATPLPTSRPHLPGVGLGESTHDRASGPGGSIADVEDRDLRARAGGIGECQPRSRRGAAGRPGAARRPDRPTPARAPSGRSHDQTRAASRLVAEILCRPEREESPEPAADPHPESARVASALVRHQDFIRTMGARKRCHDRIERLVAEGEELFGFRLRRQLGRGAFASVYLAEQRDLACRQVVLKISATEGTEHQTLARLQHTNIVPIFSVHEDSEAKLRAVCMPYFGGATLSSVLERLWDADACPTQGTQVVEALEAVGFPMSPAERERPDDGEPPEPPAPETREAQTLLVHLRGLSYDQAAAWIVAQLADGLHHAHQRGILHRDIKPSNILLSAEGQPLLLDFNVAQEMTSDHTQAILGGTVAYAAPEHLAALLYRTPDLVRSVDRRSDLYSLGLVLAEMITGERLFEQGGSYSAQATQIETMAVERSRGAPSLRRVRRDVPWSLESIVRKCLDPDPARRYQQGDHLAEDLRRFLDDRPLRYAPELSRVDRVRKFFRRHPRLLTAGPIMAAAIGGLLLVAAALVGARAHLAETSQRLGQAQAEERKRAHDAGAVRAMCLVNTILGRQDHVRQGIAVCEQTLALYQSPDGRPCDEHPDWIRLAPDERRQLAEDRRELLLLLAGARVRMVPGDRPTLVRALALLDDAEAIRGLTPSKALWLDRASYLSQLGETEKAAAARDRAGAIPATGARDHYLLAISYARQGGGEGYRKAIAELNEALNLQPRHYWSALQRGICRMELGEYAQALGDFGTCTGLWPEHPWGYFNRGCVLDRMGLKLDAIHDYSAALERDPGFAAALANRGLARVELKQYEPALEDFDRALALGTVGDASLAAGRGLALESLGRHAEADAAFKEAFTLAPYPDPARIRLKWAYGFAVSARLPEQARAAFDEVLRQDPRHPQALYGQAMLAMNVGDLASALGFFNRAVEANTGFIEARRYRAVVLSRRSQWDQATRDINWCLDREPRSGDTLYAAACVAARAAEAAPSSRALDQAFDLLERAWSLGSGLKADEDPDLAVLRRDHRFTPRMETALRTNAGPRTANSSSSPLHP